MLRDGRCAMDMDMDMGMQMDFDIGQGETRAGASESGQVPDAGAVCIYMRLCGRGLGREETQRGRERERGGGRMRCCEAGGKRAGGEGAVSPTGLPVGGTVRARARASEWMEPDGLARLARRWG